MWRVGAFYRTKSPRSWRPATQATQPRSPNKRLPSTARRKSSTPIRAVSSRQQSLSTLCIAQALSYRWTAGVPGGTMSSSSACGVALATNGFICAPTTALVTRNMAWRHTCVAITNHGHIQACKTERLIRRVGRICPHWRWQHKTMITMPLC